MTDVFLTSLHRYDGRIAKLEEGMSDCVLEHCKKHKEEKEHQASLLAWNVLSSLYKRLKGEDILEIRYNEYSKPLLKGLFFNISHSSDIVAVAISDGEIGVDIQRIDERDYLRIAKEFFCDEDYLKIKNSADPQDEFFKQWTIFEAFNKHVGTGIKKKVFIPYKEIYTEKVFDEFSNPYYLSVDCFDNERVHLSVI